MVLGLTGKYCAGKDAAAAVLSRRGFRVVDVDRVGHQALADRRSEVLASFGGAVRAPDGSVDRRSLGAIVFADRRALARLEAIVHPVMVQRVREAVAGERAAGRDVVINAAVLHRMGLDRLCDAVIVVRACFCRRLARALRRDRLPLRAALARFAAQGDVRPQQYGSGVDTYSVRNDRGTTRALERAVVAVLGRLRDRQA